MEPVLNNFELSQKAEAKEVKTKQKNFLLWLIAGGVGLIFTLVIALLIIGANLIISSTKNVTTNQTPVETKVEEVQPIPVVKSKFATDSATIKIRDDLIKLRSDIDSTDLFEAQLSPPSLDLSIKIPIAQ